MVVTLYSGSERSWLDGRAYKMQKVYFEILHHFWSLFTIHNACVFLANRMTTWFTWFLGSLYKCQRVLCINAVGSEWMGESTCKMAKFSERCHAVNTVLLSLSTLSIQQWKKFFLHNCSWNFYRVGHLVGWVDFDVPSSWAAKIKVRPNHVSDQGRNSIGK